MSTEDVKILMLAQEQLRRDMSEGLLSLGKRLGFLERTVYTLVGGITVIGFLIGTGHLKLGS